MKQMKLSLAILLTLALVLSFGTAAFAETAAATAEGLDETVTVTMTVEDGVITAVEAETDKEEETVEETELSVDDLLTTTQEHQSVEDIDLESKSEIRLMVEKFVDENPDASAQLLRNWLNEEWG